MVIMFVNNYMLYLAIHSFLWVTECDVFVIKVFAMFVQTSWPLYKDLND